MAFRAHRTAMERELPISFPIGFIVHFLGSVLHQWLSFQKAILYQTACIFSGTTASLQLDSTIGTESEEEPTYSMLSLYFNYLSTVTLIYFANIRYIECGLTRRTPDDMQYNLTFAWQNNILSTARRRMPRGAWLWRKTQGFRSQWTREPPTSPAWTTSHIPVLFSLSLFEQMPKRGNPPIGR